MSVMTTRHLVGVWNPAYGTDVMESHILLLRDRARRFASGDETEDDVYVWWGKTRSERRLTADPHIDDILSIENDLAGEDDAVKQEVQLYLTDCRSLYIAHVDEITADDPRDDDDELHIPLIYRPGGVAGACASDLPTITDMFCVPPFSNASARSCSHACFAEVAFCNRSAMSSSGTCFVSPGLHIIPTAPHCCCST